MLFCCAWNLQGNLLIYMFVCKKVSKQVSKKIDYSVQNDTVTARALRCIGEGMIEENSTGLS